MRIRRMLIAVLLVVSVLAQTSVAITTVETEVVCPICGTKNTFYTYASWGSYVYQWPSKYQQVYWPHTYSTTYYICKKCHFSMPMWDFKDFPKAKIEEVKTLLKDVTAPEKKNYNEVPMFVRLAIAEKIYRAIGRTDEQWALFYRVEGYHFAKEKKTDEALAARKKAIEYIEKALTDPKNENRKKELLVAKAAMQYFTGNESGAQDSLKAALATRYAEAGKNEEETRGYDEYLSALSKDYLSKIKAKSVPADLGGESD